MKAKAHKVSKLINEEGNTILQFYFEGLCKREAEMLYGEVKEFDEIAVEAKKYRNSRSVQQNKMLWSLLTKLSEAMNGTKDTTDVYCMILEKANIESDFITAQKRTEPALREQFRAIRERGEREMTTEKGNKVMMIVYQVWIGSSKFDTKQMTELLEITLNMCAEYGIYDMETRALMAKWEA